MLDAGVQRHDRVHARAVPEGPGRSAAGGAGPVADPAAAVAAAVAAARHRRRRAADRVRERREPADRARDVAAEGDRRPARARREPRPHRRPAAGRERAARRRSAALLGLVIASWTTRFLLGFLPTSDTPHVISGSIDNRVLAFNFALSLATGLLFGLVPALRSTQAEPRADAEGSGRRGGRRRRRRPAAQGAGRRAGHGVGAAARSAPGSSSAACGTCGCSISGLKTDNLIAFNVAPTLSGYTPVRTKQFDKQLLDRVSALPGVTRHGVRADRAARRQRVGQLDVGRRLRGEAGREHEPVLQRRQPRLFQDDGHSADRRPRLRRSRRALRGRRSRSRSCRRTRSRSSTRATRSTTSAIAARSAATSASA